MSRSKTQSRYIRNTLVDNVREHSNGESAFIYFSDKIKENGLYLLDEPENSLSPERQQELRRFIEDSARSLRLPIYYSNSFSVSSFHERG